MEGNKNVEQALQKKDIEQLGNDLKKLSKSMSDNFAEVHKRLDKTNGNVQKNTKWRYALLGGLIVISAMVIPLMLFIIKNFPE